MRYDLHIETYISETDWRGYVAILNAERDTVARYIDKAESALKASGNPNMKVQIRWTVSQ